MITYRGNPPARDLRPTHTGEKFPAPSSPQEMTSSPRIITAKNAMAISFTGRPPPPPPLEKPQLSAASFTSKRYKPKDEWAPRQHTTPEQREQIVALLDKNHSSSEIARLVGCTRNAVCGVAWRLKQKQKRRPREPADDTAIV